MNSQRFWHCRDERPGTKLATVCQSESEKFSTSVSRWSATFKIIYCNSMVSSFFHYALDVISADVALALLPETWLPSLPMLFSASAAA